MFCAGKPGVPRHLEAVGTGTDSVQLVWDAPSSDGGVPITNYVIEKRDAHHRSVWSGVGTTERTTFTAGQITVDPTQLLLLLRWKQLRIVPSLGKSWLK